MLDRPRFEQRVDREPERHPGAGDRCGPCAAIGLDDVAIEGDLVFAECLEVDHRAQGPADQALDFLRAARLLAARGFTVAARVGRARQHRILAGDPALTLATEPRRQPVFDARRAQYPGIAEADQAGAFGMFGVTGFDGNGAHLVGGATGRTCGHGAGISVGVWPPR